MKPVTPSKVWEMVELFLAWLTVLYLESMVSDLSITCREGAFYMKFGFERGFA